MTKYRVKTNVMYPNAHLYVASGTYTEEELPGFMLEAAYSKYVDKIVEKEEENPIPLSFTNEQPEKKLVPVTSDIANIPARIRRKPKTSETKSVS